MRDYYFQGARRAWTTGTPWDVQFNEMTYYLVPETYALLQTLRGSFRQDGPSGASGQKFLLVKPDGAAGLVRKRSFGVRARYQGVPLATMDIDWVYNSMPPCHGQIYPEVPLRPATSF